MLPRYPLLLREVLSSNQLGYDLEFKRGRLLGSVEITPDCRRSSSIAIFRSFAACHKVERSAWSKVLLSPRHISPQAVIQKFEADPPTVLGNLNLRYGLTDNNGRLSWDSPYQIRNAPDRTQVESIKSSFVTFQGSEPAGYFGFSIGFDRDEEYASFTVGLSLIHVRPQFRHFGIHGLDLSIAVAKLSTSIYLGILKKYRGKTPINVAIEADFDSLGGEKIGTLILDEFHYLLELLQEGKPHLAMKAGEVIAEMGI